MKKSKSWNPIQGQSSDGPIILRRRSKGQDDEMDITPMIDIVFLLLIFFLVCSHLEESSSVKLAKAVHGTAISENNATIITVDWQNDKPVVYLGDGIDGTPLSDDPAEQEQKIYDAVNAGLLEGKDIVMVKAAGNARHGDITRVTEAIGLVDGVRLCFPVRDENE